MAQGAAAGWGQAEQHMHTHAAWRGSTPQDGGSASGTLPGPACAQNCCARLHVYVTALSFFCSLSLVSAAGCVVHHMLGRAGDARPLGTDRPPACTRLHTAHATKRPHSQRCCSARRSAASIPHRCSVLSLLCILLRPLPHRCRGQAATAATPFQNTWSASAPQAGPHTTWPNTHSNRKRPW
jgi:hypothetical protein